MKVQETYLTGINFMKKKLGKLSFLKNCQEHLLHVDAID